MIEDIKKIPGIVPHFQSDTVLLEYQYPTPTLLPCFQELLMHHTLNQRLQHGLRMGHELNAMTSCNESFFCFQTKQSSVRRMTFNIYVEQRILGWVMTTTIGLLV